MAAPDPEPPPAWFVDALAAPVDLGHIEVDGCEIAYRRWGDPAKPGIILVHGGGANSRWWDHIAPFFARDCCVTALDLSGHGDSGRRYSYSFVHWAEEITALASAESGQPPVIVAHSLGGMASFVAAARHGKRFEGVIIVDSPVRQPTPEQEAQFNRQAFGPLKLYATREAALARFRVVPEQPATLPYVLANLAANSVRAGPDGWTWKFDPGFFGNMGRLDPEILSTVTCRVAILRAEFGLVTPDIGEHMYELLGRTAPVIEVPLAYHHIMLDQPIALVSAVRALLADWRHSYAHRRPV
jgi:pimeloyl-ACP methyl ester carboxylesterase